VFLTQFHQWRQTTDGSQNVSDYSGLICLLLSFNSTKKMNCTAEKEKQASKVFG
jgi:hypothetical protein